MDAQPDGLPTPQRYWAMLAIGVGIAMAVLDGAGAIALPTMTRQLHATPAASVWIVNAYQLVIVVALLPLAALGEKVSYRCVYVAGLHSLLRTTCSASSSCWRTWLRA